MSQCPSFFEVGSIQALKDANEMWPKPLTEMTVVKLSYQLKLTNHTILYK